ncbi:MAG: A24 family peptidase [Blautia sp.]|nr:A24 family peptidase [Blautia sp.]MCM1199911.1 A24 family peptidase [Bacteroides fragilis]
MDFTYDRICNELILSGMILGLFSRFPEYQWHGLYEAAVSMTLSFALLYPLYKIGGLGAGDVKLFLVIGSFVQAGEVFRIIIASFIIGGIISIGKLVSGKLLLERKPRGGQQRYGSNKIHFALPVLIGAALWTGGFY